MKPIAFVVVGLLLLSPGVPAAARGTPAATVKAGPLTVEIHERPWRLVFRDQANGTVLETRTGGSSGPTGSLGFHVADATQVPSGVAPAKPQDPNAPGRDIGWVHATSVAESGRDGDAYVARLDTTDPQHRIDVRVEAEGDGVVAVRAEVAGDTALVDAMGISFQATDSERFYGFGERSHAIDLRGTTVEHYVGEGPYQDEEQPFVQAVVPAWGMRWRDDATYYPIPWLLSSRGYGVLLDNPDVSYHRLGTDVADAWSAEVEAARMDLRVFAGPEPLDALRRFTDATGRQPFPARPWFLGPWFQTGHDSRVPLEDERRYVRTLQDADAPVSVAETHMRYLPCGDHRGRREGERERTAFFNSRGLASVSYVNPMICEEYAEVFDEAVARSLLQERPDGDAYVFPAYAGGRTPPVANLGQFDFTADGAAGLYGEVISMILADGHRGWMEDFAEYTPLNSVSDNGMAGTEMHNLYPRTYHCAVHDLVSGRDEPVARYVRSGWTGQAPCVPLVWGGDPTTSWEFDGLTSAIRTGLTMGLSGIAFWGSDIGGFHALGFNELTPELLIRWIQFGAVSPLMRTKSEGVAVPDKERPQIWEPDILPHWRRWAKLHTQLSPYLLGAAGQYEETGVPLMRHLALAYPDADLPAVTDDEYLLGDHLLAAPVHDEGARERRVHLPPGRWVDLWRSAAFVEETGGLRVTGRHVLEGDREVTLPAPLDEAPLLVRAGAVIPLLPADVDTLTRYGAGTDVVRAEDRVDRVTLLAFPAGETTTRFNRREHLRSTLADDRWDVTIDGERVRTYDLQAALPASFTPCAVTVDGAPLPRGAWSLDEDTHVLRVTFRGQDTTLVARTDCGAGGSVADADEPPLPATGGGAAILALLTIASAVATRRAPTTPATT